MNPMIPFLTGWLVSAISEGRSDRHGSFLIVSLDPEPPNRININFFSGLKLRLTVEEVSQDAQ